MQSSHAATKIDMVFDDPNLIADAGLVPVVALAERVGLAGLVTDRVRISGAVNSAGLRRVPELPWSGRMCD